MRRIEPKLLRYCKESTRLLYNVSFKTTGIDRLYPSVPYSAAEGEDKTIERVCLADSIAHCFQSIGASFRDLHVGVVFEVREAAVDPEDELLIKPKQLWQQRLVPDALENQEYWYLGELPVVSYQCELENFNYDYGLAWSCVDACDVRRLLKKYTDEVFDGELSSEELFEATAKVLPCDVLDELWYELSELPWAQKLEISDVRVRRIKSMSKNQHPVWNVLNREKYVEEFYPKAEEMYDLIKCMITACGFITKDGNTVPAMKVFFDYWNEYSHETFAILGSLIRVDGANSLEQIDSFK